MITHKLPGEFLAASRQTRAQAQLELFKGLIASRDTALAGLLALITPVRPPILNQLSDRLREAGWDGDLASHTALVFNIHVPLGPDEALETTVQQVGFPQGIISDPLPSNDHIRRVVPELPSEEDLHIIKRLESAVLRFVRELAEGQEQNFELYARWATRLTRENKSLVGSTAEFLGIFSPQRVEHFVEALKTQEPRDECFYELWLHVCAKRPAEYWTRSPAHSIVYFEFIKEALKRNNPETRRHATFRLTRHAEVAAKINQTVIVADAQSLLEDLARNDPVEEVRGAALSRFMENSYHGAYLFDPERVVTVFEDLAPALSRSNLREQLKLWVDNLNCLHNLSEELRQRFRRLALRYGRNFT